MALNQQMAREQQEQRQMMLSPTTAQRPPQAPRRVVLHAPGTSPERSPSPRDRHSPQSPTEESDRGRLRHRPPPRSYSTTQDPGYDTASLERPGRTPHSNRNSMYSSGTQSAYTSRDSSPEKGHKYRLGKSPYPAPPPSFLITPPRSPRTFSPSPHSAILTSENMLRLYEKLGQIDRHNDDQQSQENLTVTQSAAIAKERTGAVRVLMKSMSVDSYAEDIPLQGHQGQLPERMSFIELLRNSKTYEDAPLSQTLPASIRIGELVITPGIEALSKTFAPTVFRTKAVLSPKSQRRKFFDEYPQDSESFAIQELERVAQAQQKELERSRRSRPPHSGAKHRDKSTDSVQSVDSVTKRERSISEKASAFFAAVKEKRKKFGSKRTGSVEESATGGEIARAGITAARPVAPSTPEPHPNETPSRDKRRFFHRRAASIDLTTLFRSRESSRDRSSSKLRAKSPDVVAPQEVRMAWSVVSPD